MFKRFVPRFFKRGELDKTEIPETTPENLGKAVAEAVFEIILDKPGNPVEIMGRFRQEYPELIDRIEKDADLLQVVNIAIAQLKERGKIIQWLEGERVRGYRITDKIKEEILQLRTKLREAIVAIISSTGHNIFTKNELLDWLRSQKTQSVNRVEAEGRDLIAEMRKILGQLKRDGFIKVHDNKDGEIGFQWCRDEPRRKDY